MCACVSVFVSVYVCVFLCVCFVVFGCFFFLSGSILSFPLVSNKLVAHFILRDLDFLLCFTN